MESWPSVKLPAATAGKLWVYFKHITLDFLAPFLPPVFFDTVFFCDGDFAFFAGGGVMMASSFPFDPRFFASSSGWILGNTPPLAMVTPFNS